MLVIIINNFISAQSSIDTFEVYSGWNLIGSLSSGATINVISTEPPGIMTSSIFGFSPLEGYYEADTLKRGKGYWIKVSQDGIIIVGAAVQTPTLASPSNGESNVTLPPTLIWNSISGGTSYTLQVSTTNNFSSYVFNQSGLTTTNQQVSSLNNSTQYFWRVNASNGTGTSSWSTVWNFTTQSGGPGQPCPGVPFVVYSGKTYNTIQIGSQCWLRENLDVGTMISGSQNAINNGVIEKYCFNNDPNNCNLYGGLYQWNELMQYSTTPGTQGICPPGWHIPTLTEMQTLSSIVNNDGNSLKSIGQGVGGGAGTNTSGFSALLTGYRNFDGNFINFAQVTHFWSSSEAGGTTSYSLHIGFDNNGIFLINYSKDDGFCVRCIKD